MKSLFIVFSIIAGLSILAACNINSPRDESKAPSIASHVEWVPALGGHGIMAIHDGKNGVICYTGNNYTLSCVAK